MSAIPCRFSVTCTPCDENPMGNYSSEGPEQQPVYLSLVFPESWDKMGCLSLCESTVSQQEADLCALAQAAQCNPPIVTPGTGGDPNDDGGGGGGGGTTIFNPQFFNAEQTCEVTCDDGQAFTFVVPAGTFSATTQEAADARAEAYACDKAADNKVCIGALSVLEACVGESYSGSITVFIASGLSIADLSITSGALPDGLTISVQTLGDQNLTINITGTPTSVAVSDFTIHVQDAAGNQQSRDFSISTVEITQSTMTNGKVGNDYSQTLTISGTTTGTVTWGVADLPLGLSINTSTGAITGIPESTAEGTSQFTATFTDDNVSCSKQISITIEPGVDFSELTWTLQSLTQDDGATASWISPGEGAQSNEWATQASAPIAVGQDPIGRVIIKASLTYAGPNLPCRAEITVSNNNALPGGFGGTSSSIQYFLNSGLVSSAQMTLVPAGFNGTYNLNFTAQAGLLEFIIDMFSNDPGGVQSDPMTIQVNGIFVNL